MARYVIVIKADRVALTGFDWEVRELLVDGSGTPLERSGPTLIFGTAPDVISAKNAAETQAERLGQEESYIYNTITQEPTPLP